jgi:flavin reductase (DIM6/NTAB) family NADH-FMN oxidoreductase RutF
VSESEIDRGVFRTVLGHFASGVAVVAGRDGGTPLGFTCQSFFSLSLDPPLVAIAPSRASTSWPRMVPSGSFTVSVLAEDQEALARVFATSGGDKFAGIGWSAGRTGAPRIHDCLAWVDCHIEAIHEGGDHLVVVGRVVDLEVGGGVPLLFYRGGFGGFRS